MIYLKLFWAKLLRFFSRKTIIVEKPIVRFMQPPKLEAFRRVFGSAEWMWFIDNCKREYLYKLESASEEKDIVKKSLTYQGICFVEEQSQSILARLREPEEMFDESDVLGLSDEALKAEAGL